MENPVNEGEQAKRGAYVNAIDGAYERGIERSEKVERAIQSLNEMMEAYKGVSDEELRQEFLAAHTNIERLAPLYVWQARHKLPLDPEGTIDITDQ